MIFISAVPDNYYFLWQIEIQLYNFSNCQISARDIHVLIGVDKKYGLSTWFNDLIDRNKDKASFFVYPIQKDFIYSPSVRPHLLHHHFLSYPALEEETLFYHDSDIIFRELPDLDSLCAGKEWYVADCRSYLDSGYLRSAGGNIFSEMCEVLSIDTSLVEGNDENAGGAQYILKNVSPSFWEAMETDCEKLFQYLVSQPMREEKIQSWCSDMWVLFWNALKQGRDIRISEELSFSWAGDPIEQFAKHKIYHNTGIPASIDQRVEKVFNKTDFHSHSPYYIRHDHYSKKYCAYEFVKLIEEYERSLQKEDFNDVSFLIPLFVDTDDRLANLEIVTRYIHKYFHTNIIVVEAGTEPKVQLHRLPPCVTYRFVPDERKYFHHTRYNNLLTGLSQTRFIAIYDVDVIFSSQQLIESVKALRSGEVYISYPYDGLFYSSAGWTKDIFKRTLDHRTLSHFKDHMSLGSQRSYGGCVLLDRATFIANGLDNEHFTSWGPEDIERAIRYKILGYKVHRAPGSLYHLPHARGVNSNYQEDTYVDLMSEYMRICSCSKDELREYIDSWNFSTKTL